MEHPEGVFHELDRADDRCWHLGFYERCLDSWDVMNLALTQAQKNLAKDQSTKNTLRYQGLTILKEVDNRD
jgi:hypothetical protein